MDKEVEVQSSFEDCDWDSCKTIYTCNLYSAAVKSKQMKVKNFKGKHQKKKTNADVRGLTFNSTCVRFIPIGLESFFPQIVALEIKNCGLVSISSDNLKGFPHLQELCVFDNELKSLPSDLFVNSKKLTWIEFDSNRLEFLSSKMFDSIPDGQLVCANFKGNERINASWSQTDNSGVKSLDELKAIIDSSCLPLVYELSRALWGDETFSDFTIIVDSKKFKLHKCVLSNHSPVLAKMLTNDASNMLEIENCEADVVQEFLRGLYVGEFSNEGNALDVFVLADVFDVPELKSHCEKIVVRTLEQNDAVKVFKIGHQYKSARLIDCSFEMLKTRFPHIKLPESLKHNPDQRQKIIHAIEKCIETILGIVDECNTMT